MSYSTSPMNILTSISTNSGISGSIPVSKNSTVYQGVNNPTLMNSSSSSATNSNSNNFNLGNSHKGNGHSTNSAAPVTNSASNSNSNLNGNGLSEKSPNSKNLSHVPCKFFRQGVCQAGNSCPFSHAADSTNETVPCKYFQKGNCKFGLKCALAHILPDGRRINSKSLAQAYQHANNNPSSQPIQQQVSQSSVSQQQSSSSQQSFHRNSISIPVGSSTSGLPMITSPTSNSNGVYMNNFSGSNSNQMNIAGSTNPIEISYSYQQQQQQQQSQSLNQNSSVPASYSSTQPLYVSQTSPVASQGSYNLLGPSKQQSVPQVSSNSFSNSIWNSGFNENNRNSYLRSYSSSASNNFNLNGLGNSAPTNELHSNSFNQPINSAGTPTSRPILSYTNSHNNNGNNTVYSTISESAIDDDEDDFAYEEDFVPSSLSDLLTPQELQRRGSRPSSSMPRPNLSHLINPNNTSQFNSNNAANIHSHINNGESLDSGKQRNSSNGEEMDSESETQFFMEDDHSVHPPSNSVTGNTTIFQGHNGNNLIHQIENLNIRNNDF